MKRLLLVPLAVLAVAAFPASGLAATQTYNFLAAGPVQVKAYKMYVLAYPRQPRSAPLLFIEFERGSALDRQSHFYSFSHGVSVKIAADGSSASVHAALGRWREGTCAHELLRDWRGQPAAVGCGDVVVSHHQGQLSASHGFDLVSQSPYFGDIRASTLPASTITVRGQDAVCKATPSKPAQGVLLSVVKSAGGEITSFSVSHSGAFTGEDLDVTELPESAAAPVIEHVIQVTRLPGSAFTFAPDLSSAQANGLGTFLSGSLDFTRMFTYKPNDALGTASGDLAARFDGLGLVQLGVGAQTATLDNL